MNVRAQVKTKTPSFTGMSVSVQPAAQTAPKLALTPAPIVSLRSESPGVATECQARNSRQLNPQRRSSHNSDLGAVPPIVHDALREPGQPLDAATRSFMEPRFGHNFSQVRVHTDAQAAESARTVNALAFTVGHDVVFDAGRYSPNTAAGRRLLAHELTHTIQQGGAEGTRRGTQHLGVTPEATEAEKEADAAAADVGSGLRPRITMRPLTAPAVQRDTFHTPSVSVRSPVVEEAVTQLTDLLPGRALTRDERTLASGVFGSSIDFSRVRLIPTSILEYRTVGNSIRIPENFTIADEYMGQTFIHELTHVWQYQHGGTSYISISLGSQIAAGVGRGGRNFAYDYRINPDQTFFDFTPEQQASIVESYFMMQRDQTAIPRDQAAGSTATYESNHRGGEGGFRIRLSASDRLAEISSELPLHETLLSQMRAALPRPEVDILRLRASEVMRLPGQDLIPPPRGLELVPIKPLLEIRF